MSSNVYALSEKSDEPTGCLRKLRPIPLCRSNSADMMLDCCAALACDSTQAAESVSDPPNPSICWYRTVSFTSIVGSDGLPFPGTNDTAGFCASRCVPARSVTHTPDVVGVPVTGGGD